MSSGWNYTFPPLNFFVFFYQTGMSFHPTPTCSATSETHNLLIKTKSLWLPPHTTCSVSEDKITNNYHHDSSTSSHNSCLCPVQYTQYSQAKASGSLCCKLHHREDAGDQIIYHATALLFQCRVPFLQLILLSLQLFSGCVVPGLHPWHGVVRKLQHLSILLVDLLSAAVQPCCCKWDELAL